MGDAEGGGEVPGEKVVDFVYDRRGHSRGFPKPERPGAISAALLSRTLQGHRRLDSGHERYPTLYAQIRTEPAGALHRQGANAHTGAHREPAERNRQLQTGTLLGAGHRLPRHHLHGHQRTVHQQGRGRAGFPNHCGKAFHRYRCAKEKGNGTAAKPLRPYLAAGGM